MLDWTTPLRHPTLYKAVFRPAVLRANRLTPTAKLPAGLRFHSLRHTYASLCAAVPTISVRQVAEWIGHANPTTTELVYTHLYAKAEHDDEMAALGALAATPKISRRQRDTAAWLTSRDALRVHTQGERVDFFPRLLHMGVEPLNRWFRMLAEVVVAAEALVGAFDPVQLLVGGGDAVEDRLYVPGIGQGVVVYLRD